MSDMKKATSMLKRAQVALQETKQHTSNLEEKVASLESQVADFERRQLAEEIVFVKVASGALSFDDIQDFQDEVLSLYESGEDLNQVKLAMKHYGPRAFSHALAEVGEEVVKEANTTQTQVPKGHEAAYAEFQEALASLNTD